MQNIQKIEMRTDRTPRNCAGRRASIAIATGMLALSLALIASAGRSYAAESVLYAFAGGSDGEAPVAGLIANQSGTLYGTTPQGGGSGCLNNLGCGTVFALTPPTVSGGAWTETVLYAFQGSPSGDGANPVAGLLAGPNGTLYDTTRSGGTSNAGTVFNLSPPVSTVGRWTGRSLLFRRRTQWIRAVSGGYWP